MICFCAGRFQWRRIWQNPGELLLPDFQTWPLARSSIGGPPNLRLSWSTTARNSSRSSSDGTGARAAIPCVSTRPTARRSSPCRRAARSRRRGSSRRCMAAGSPPVLAPAEGRAVPAGHRVAAARRASSHRASAGERGTVWTETRDSGEKILCVAGDAEYTDRRVHDFLSARRARICRRPRRVTLGNSACGCGGYRSATSQAAGVRAPRRVAVVFLAAGARAALRARLPRRP